jgi:DNA repair protein RecO (recombination protein O)
MGLIDAMMYSGRSLDSITQAESLFSFGAELAGDYPRWTAAQAICETAERLTPEEQQPARQQFQLLVAGLRALAQRGHAPGLILDAYLVRSLAVAGWGASFDACARCGRPGPHRAFSLPGGGALCTACRVPGCATPRPETLELLGALLSGHWELADASEEWTRREAAGLVAAYLQWHLERQLKSLPLVERA